MSIKVELTIEQIADTLRNMKPEEVETLEYILDKKTEDEILKRRKEAREGKTISINEVESFKGL